MLSLRLANLSDAIDLLLWRNDALTRAMSIESHKVKLRDHLVWLSAKLHSSCSLFLIGELAGAKLGSCRFDIDEAAGQAEVSINLNPNMRGQGYGRALLDSSINYFLKVHPLDIKASVKRQNRASLRIFERCGFIPLHHESSTTVQRLIRINAQSLSAPQEKAKVLKSLSLEMVNGSDSHKAELYQLLAARTHRISHLDLPSRDQHNRFVDQHPYRLWYLIKRDESDVGSVYLTKHNSIGINLHQDADHEDVREIIGFILSEIKPLPELKSVRPGTFTINIAPTNQPLTEAVSTLGAREIQTTFSLMCPW